MQPSFQLGILHCRKNLAEQWSRTVALRDQIVAGQQWRRENLILRQSGNLFLCVLIKVEPAVAAETVQAVQLQVLGKIGQAREALERRFLHLLHVGKAHVIGHQRRNLFRIVIAEAQTMADLFRHAHADLDMAVEAYAVGSDS